jgi:hydrogenase-1 operon protein HyaF
MSEHVLVWRPELNRRASGEEAPLRLLEMPAGLRRSRRQVLAAETLSVRARAALLEALAALRALATGPGEPVRIALRHLAEDERAVLLDLIGEGEVRAVVGGANAWSIVESVLPGLWRLEVENAQGEQVSWLEVASVPSPVLQAAERMTVPSVSVPASLPDGTMNAVPLLNELDERARLWRHGDENHVVNFTLLPLTEADAEVLTATVGQIPLLIRSEGYGSCRIFATQLRHVWAVQYLNSMGKVILDTMEVGGVPVSACAAREDFEDSAQRLAEMLQAYAS